MWKKLGPASAGPLEATSSRSIRSILARSPFRKRQFTLTREIARRSVALNFSLIAIFPRRDAQFAAEHFVEPLNGPEADIAGNYGE